MATDKDDNVQILASPHSTSPEVTLAEIPSAADDFGFLPRRDDDRRRRADLGFFYGQGHVHYIVDVAVMAPTAASYLQKESFKIQNAAHHLIEADKVARYLSHTNPSTPLPVTYSLIPFIIDCTGNVGTKTELFFLEQCMSNSRKKSALRKIRALMEEFNAQLRSKHTKYGIPSVNPYTRLRIPPSISSAERPRRRRGRPVGSRNRRSRGHISVAIVQQQQQLQTITSNALAIPSDDDNVDALIPTEASGEE